jgi:hypothetical protein
MIKKEGYLEAYESVFEAQASIGHSLSFHHAARPHSRLGRQTLDQVDFDLLPRSRVA